MASNDSAVPDPKKYSGSGTYRGFHAEVRLRSDDGFRPKPVVAGNLVITAEDWTRIPVTEVFRNGFRSELWTWSEHAKQIGLLDFEVAHGIAAQFHALYRLHNYLFEFRLIREQVEYSYAHWQDAEGEPFDFSQMEAASFSKAKGKP